MLLKSRIVNILVILHKRISSVKASELMIFSPVKCIANIIDCQFSVLVLSILSSDIFLLALRPVGLKAFRFVGDNTGFIHIGPNQTVTAQIANHDHFAVNVFVHKDGHMTFPPKFTCYDVIITVRFVLLSIVGNSTALS